MYIEPFWAGFILGVVSGAVVIIALAIAYSKKGKK